MKGKLTAAALTVTLAACGSQQPAATNASATLDTTTNDANGGERSRRGYLRADADDDGIVTRAEIAREAEARFRSIDTDGDGSVSSAKLSGRRRRALGTSEEAAGGRPARPITLAQFRARALARFDRRDADGNGRLEGDELKRRPRLKRPEEL